jgi:hypothetical protein
MRQRQRQVSGILMSIQKVTVLNIPGERAGMTWEGAGIWKGAGSGSSEGGGWRRWHVAASHSKLPRLKIVSESRSICRGGVMSP